MSRMRTSVGLLLFLLSGCQAHLVYVYEAVLGIDVAASTKGTGRISFGYDENTFALVPKKTPSPGMTNPSTSDAMSLAAISCVYADGLNAVNFDHFVASGTPAASIANDPDALGKIRAAIYGTGTDQCK